MNKVFNGKGSIRKLLKEMGTVIALFAVTAFLAGCSGSYQNGEWSKPSYDPCAVSFFMEGSAQLSLKCE